MLAASDYTGALAALDALLNWTSRADVSVASASERRLQYLRAGAGSQEAQIPNNARDEIGTTKVLCLITARAAADNGLGYW